MSGPCVDPIPLMHQLARMANIPESWACKMVLVLEIDCAPKLFVETFLDREKGEQLVETKLEVSEEPIIVNTTTMQNKTFVTHAPISGV